MKEELRQLYQDVILDHGRHPRNFGPLAEANRDAQGYNPMCGDAVHIYMKLEGDGTIKDISFDGKGCAISIASASIMTEILKGQTVKHAEELFQYFRRICTEDDALFVADDSSDEGNDNLARLEVLGGVRDFPVRVKCATLAWHAMHAALEGNGGTSTE